MSQSKGISKISKEMSQSLQNNIPINNGKHKLIESIHSDCKNTIQRLRSIHHSRSPGGNNSIHNHEELWNEERMHILNSIEMLYPEDAESERYGTYSDDDDPFGDNVESKCRSEDDAQNHKIAISRPSNDDILHSNGQQGHSPNLKMDDITSPLTITRSLPNDNTPNHTTRVIPLQSSTKRKIIRQKTPLPPASTTHIPFDSSTELNTEQKIYVEDDLSSEFQSISGILEKQSASKFRGWQRRWFYLYRNTLSYFKEGSIPIKGSIDLRNVVHCKIADHLGDHMTSKGRRGSWTTLSATKKQRMFTFELVMKGNHHSGDPNAGRTYQCRTDDESIRDQWVDIINHNLHILQQTRSRAQSPGPSLIHRQNRLNPNTRQRSRSIDFVTSKDHRNRSRRLRSSSETYPNGSHSHPTLDTNPTISCRDVLTANTGDILLFRTKSPAGAIVRAATGGSYDHIGVLIRLTRNRLGVLEALGSGIQVFLWSNFRKYKWNEQYLCMKMRRLNIPDDRLRDEVTRNLTMFARIVMKRKYGFNPIQLIRQQSQLSLQDESRSFFCSELVAKAFKETGLLRRDVGSAAYFPSTFQESKGLMLLKGCSFGPETEIIWDDDVPKENPDGMTAALHHAMKSDVSVVSLK